MKTLQIIKYYIFLAIFAVILISSFTLLALSRNLHQHSCTIFSVSKDGKVLFANNEDEGLHHGRIWFYPSYDGKYGKILLGYAIHHNLEIYVGGMNDQGLCFDMNAIRTTPIKSVPERIDYQGAYFLEMLERCATVEEVKQWAQQYNLYLLTRDQCHVADSTGDAMVMGLDSYGLLTFTEKSGDYLISTNFNLASESNNCWRYNTTKQMLDDMNELTVEYCRDILRTVKLETNTMYSNIFDLKYGMIYLYSHQNFDRVAILNMEEEFSKGFHSYDIETLVSQQTGIIEESSLNSILITSLIIGCSIFCCIVIYLYKLKPELS